MNDSIIKQKILDRIAELKDDERLTYNTATIQVNAPLALIQLSKKAAIHELEGILGIERTKFPLPKKETNADSNR